MKKQTSLQFRPCLITALELLGLDQPSVTEAQLRNAFRGIDLMLGSGPLVESTYTKIYEEQLFIKGNKVLHIAPVQAGGAILFKILLNIVHLQPWLWPEHLLVRGAVTMGKAAVRANATMGPGISEAERLRDQVAEFPRVIIDPRLFREVEGNADLRGHPAMNELQYLGKLVREDSDGIWFVDYLRAMEHEVDQPSAYLDLLNYHRTRIHACLEKAKSLDHTTRHWTWLRTYHNRVIDEAHRARRLTSTEAESCKCEGPFPLVYAFPPSAKLSD